MMRRKEGDLQEEKSDEGFGQSSLNVPIVEEGDAACEHNHTLARMTFAQCWQCNEHRCEVKEGWRLPLKSTRTMEGTCSKRGDLPHITTRFSIVVSSNEMIQFLSSADMVWLVETASSLSNVMFWRQNARR